jgi:cell division protease FtsH
MSSTLSLSVSPTLIFKPQNLSKDTNLTKSNNKETQSQQTLLDTTKLTKRKLLTSSVIGLVPSCVAQPTRSEPESPNASTSSRISYTRFLQYLDEGVVKKVDLLENGTVAIAEIYNQTLDKIQRVKIQLPGLPKELVRKIKDKNVDFGVYPMDINWGDAVLDLLGNLAFPLILLGSLLLRSSRNNPVGGPNLPFGLGRYELPFVLVMSSRF